MSIDEFIASAEKGGVVQLDFLYALVQMRLLEIHKDAKEYRGRPINTSNGDCKRLIKHLRTEQSTTSEAERARCDNIIRHIHKEWMDKGRRHEAPLLRPLRYAAHECIKSRAAP